MTPGRHITPAGGRLTIEMAAGHHRITLDHLGCAAQATPPKDDAYKQLALAAEGYCLHAGCTHRPRFATGIYRCFELLEGSIGLGAFVRAMLAIELGDFEPVARLAGATAAAVGRTATTPDPAATLPPAARSGRWMKPA